jgi:RNA polymerase sigma factor (sigma-70 family)
MATTNKALIASLLKRDPDAFTEIVRAFEESISRTAYRIVGQHSDADEVRQKVFLKVWQAPKKLPQPDKLAAWLRRCTVNESIATLRRRAVTERVKRSSMPATSMPATSNRILTTTIPLHLAKHCRIWSQVSAPCWHSDLTSN